MRRRFVLLVLAAILAGFHASAALAEPPPDPAVMALLALFRSPADAERLVSPSFAEEIPPRQLGRYVLFYEQTIGLPMTVVRDGDDYALTTSRGSLRAAIELDAAGKIASLRFHDETSPIDTDALVRVLKSDRLDPAWFAYNAQRDAAVVRTQKILSGLHATLGAFSRVAVRRGAYVAIFAHGETHVQVAADNSGVISYLSFEQP